MCSFKIWQTEAFPILEYGNNHMDDFDDASEKINKHWQVRLFFILIRLNNKMLFTKVCEVYLLCLKLS